MAVAERAPVSRAARAQRIGRPGRPTLPPSSPKPRRWFRRFVALIALLFIGAALYVINETFQPFQDEREQEGGVAVQIPEGADARSIGELLERKGVIDDARFFELNATLTLRRGKLRTGNYVLRRSMTNGAAIDALLQGPKVRVVKTFNVTIPEGLSRREAAPAVDESGIEGSYLKASGSDKALARARRLGAPKGRRTIEGFLFPATYELRAGATAGNLVDKQLDAFRDNFRRIDLTKAKRKNLTRYDLVIIASMIERETSSDKERPLISSVIYNRLKQGIPLGIDATIRYSENNWTDPLKQSELERDGPYNTRLRQGLPPTPIGNPGLASLKAAAAPGQDGLHLLRGQAGRVPRVLEHGRRVRARRRRLRGRAGEERRQRAAAEVLTYLGVAGWPVAHSRSPAIQNAALAAAGLSGWRYLKLPLPPERFAETVRALPAAGFRGINVTIPHKRGGARARRRGDADRRRRRGGEHADVPRRRGDPRRQHRRAGAAGGAARRRRGHDGAGARRRRCRARRGLRAAQRRSGRGDGVESHARARRAARG